MNRPKGQKTDPWSKIYLACIFFMNISAAQRLTRKMSYEIDNLGYHRELSNFETELFFLCQSHIKRFCLHCISEPRASVTPLNSCANTPVDTSKTFAYTLISRPMYIAHSTFFTFWDNKPSFNIYETTQVFALFFLQNVLLLLVTVLTAWRVRFSFDAQIVRLLVRSFVCACIQRTI